MSFKSVAAFFIFVAAQTDMFVQVWRFDVPPAQLGGVTVAPALTCLVNGSSVAVSKTGMSIMGLNDDPSLEEVVARLLNPCKVATSGCGHGWTRDAFAVYILSSVGAYDS